MNEGSIPLSIQELDERVFADIFSGGLRVEDLVDGGFGPQPGDEDLTFIFFDKAEKNHIESRRLGKVIIDEHAAVLVAWLETGGKLTSLCERIDDSNKEYWALRAPKAWEDYFLKKNQPVEMRIDLQAIPMTPLQRTRLEAYGVESAQALADLTDKQAKEIEGMDAVALREVARQYMKLVKKQVDKIQEEK